MTHRHNNVFEKTTAQEYRDVIAELETMIGETERLLNEQPVEVGTAEIIRHNIQVFKRATAIINEALKVKKAD